MERYELSGNKWKRTGRPLKVKVGKSGMGWGIGLHSPASQNEPHKREGDGRSPAGIFSIAFAFGEKKPDTRMPFRTMSKYHICVDDSRSKYYNKIIDKRKAKKDYNSFENMKLASGLYRYGLYISHNFPQKPKGGSCIFMHIKKIRRFIYSM
jgi:D-alanyl-D-alanine dipeptidase